MSCSRQILNTGATWYPIVALYTGMLMSHLGDRSPPIRRHWDLDWRSGTHFCVKITRCEVQIRNGYQMSGWWPIAQPESWTHQQPEKQTLPKTVQARTHKDAVNPRCCRHSHESTTKHRACVLWMSKEGGLGLVLTGVDWNKVKYTGHSECACPALQPIGKQMKSAKLSHCVPTLAERRNPNTCVLHQ